MVGDPLLQTIPDAALFGVAIAAVCCILVELKQREKPPIFRRRSTTVTRPYSLRVPNFASRCPKPSALAYRTTQLGTK